MVASRTTTSTGRRSDRIAIPQHRACGGQSGSKRNPVWTATPAPLGALLAHGAPRTSRLARARVNTVSAGGPPTLGSRREPSRHRSTPQSPWGFSTPNSRRSGRLFNKTGALSPGPPSAEGPRPACRSSQRVHPDRSEPHGSALPAGHHPDKSCRHHARSDSHSLAPNSNLPSLDWLSTQRLDMVANGLRSVAGRCRRQRTLQVPGNVSVAGHLVV